MNSFMDLADDLVNKSIRDFNRQVERHIRNHILRGGTSRLDLEVRVKMPTPRSSAETFMASRHGTYILELEGGVQVVQLLPRFFRPNIP